MGPVRRTIGASAPVGSFYDNITTAFDAGIPSILLPGKHFSQVSVPEQVAEHIRSTRSMGDA